MFPKKVQIVGFNIFNRQTSMLEREFITFYRNSKLCTWKLNFQKL